MYMPPSPHNTESDWVSIGKFNQFNLMVGSQGTVIYAEEFNFRLYPKINFSKPANQDSPLTKNFYLKEELE